MRGRALLTLGRLAPGLAALLVASLGFLVFFYSRREFPGRLKAPPQTPQRAVTGAASEELERDFYGMLKLPVEHLSHRITYSTCVDYDKETTLAQIAGKGSIRKIFLVTGMGNRPARPAHCTYPVDSIAMTLRIYFDGEEKPSIETPLGPLMGIFHDLNDTYAKTISTPLLQTSPNGAHTITIPMPYSNGVRITLQMDSPPDETKMRVWMQTNYHAYPPDATVDPLRLKAVYKRASVEEYKKGPFFELHRNDRRYHVGHARGRGFILGVLVGIVARDRRDWWFHGGGDLIMLDSESFPRVLKGTGGEDMFGESCWTREGWGGWDQGFHLSDPWPRDDFRMMKRGVGYRFYLRDRIPYKTSFNFDMGRVPMNEISTVLLYYHTGDSDPIVKSLPPFKNRLEYSSAPHLDIPAPYWSRYPPSDPRAVPIPVWKVVGPFPATNYSEFLRSYPPKKRYAPKYAQNMTFWKFKNHTTHWHDFIPAYGWVHLAPLFFPYFGEANTNEAQPYLSAVYMHATLKGKGSARLRVVADDWIRCWVSGTLVYERSDIPFSFQTEYAPFELHGEENLVCKVANSRNVNGKTWAVLIEVELLNENEEYRVPEGWGGWKLQGVDMVQEGACA